LKEVSKTPNTPVTIGEYTYDALNRRIRKVVSNGGLSGTIPNGTTDFIYNAAWQCVEERDGSNNVFKQYVWGRYIDELLQMKTATTINGNAAGEYYPLCEILYNMTALTDSAGAIVEAYDTDAYGNKLIFVDPGTGGAWFADDAVTGDNPTCEFIFTSRRYDPEKKTDQFRNREYDPVTGRFPSKDPIGYHEGMNFYRAYFIPGGIDPLGLADCYCPREKCKTLSPINKEIDDAVNAAIAAAANKYTRFDHQYEFGGLIRDALADETTGLEAALMRSKNSVMGEGSFLERFGQARCMKVKCGGAWYCVGSDKIGHMFDTGYIMFEFSEVLNWEKAVAWSLWTESLYDPESPNANAAVTKWLKSKMRYDLRHHGKYPMRNWKGIYGIGQQSMPDHLANIGGAEFYYEMLSAAHRVRDSTELPAFDICRFVTKHWEEAS
jgi:RHS repeat-associated protein